MKYNIIKQKQKPNPQTLMCICIVLVAYEEEKWNLHNKLRKMRF